MRAGRSNPEPFGLDSGRGGAMMARMGGQESGMRGVPG